MEIISIDVGSYSVKILESIGQKKTVNHISYQEIVLDSVKKRFDAEIPLHELQFKVIEEFLSKIEKEIRIISSYPGNEYTVRLIDLPTTNKKKAELMLPFQLEDEIPFSTNEFHLCSNFIKKKESIKALTSVIGVERFDEYFEQLKVHNIFPNYLTTEISAIASFLEEENNLEETLLIDSGHRSTKAYFISDGQISSYNLSHIGGHNVTEAISSTYGLSLDEAREYKHQNAFFLLEEQFNSVDEDQKNFALMMDSIFKPFIKDLQRWILGHKVNSLKDIKTIKVFGGNSNIKNFNNYISEKVGVPTYNFEPFQVKSIKNINTPVGQIPNPILTHIMSFDVSNKNYPANLLSGRYSTSNSEDIPVYSLTFNSLRIAIVLSLFLLTFTIENFLVNKKTQTVEKTLTKIIKTPELEINSRMARNLKRNPEKILLSLERKKKKIESEIKAIQQNSKINAIDPLFILSKQIQPFKQVDMISFSSNKNSATATFKTNEQNALKLFRQSLDRLTLKNKKISLNSDRGTLTLRFKY